MTATLYTLTSDLHSEIAPVVGQEPFIKAIEAELGQAFQIRGGDFSDYGTHPLEVIYVRTGGTEGIFRSLFCKDGQSVSIPEPVRLLTSGRSNSLAASMEIISFLNQKGVKGEILHGTAAEIAESLRAGEGTEAAGDLRLSVNPAKVLDGQRFGVLGRPSDWLISSDVDYTRAADVLGVELVDVSMDEVLAQIGLHSHPDVTLPPLCKPRYGNCIRPEDLEVSLDIYGALRRIIDKYSLSGLTIRCFDLLSTVHNTGCMALALLNSEGFTATCEGDIPAMLSMAIARKVSGTPGFQANLSRIVEGAAPRSLFLFAHCTLPLSMAGDWVYDTHFESGIGVAVHGHIKEGPATIFKLSPDFRKAFVFECSIQSNRYESGLCRTQILVEAPGAAPYFLTGSIGNHHIIVPGHVAGELRTLLRG